MHAQLPVQRSSRSLDRECLVSTTSEHTVVAMSHPRSFTAASNPYQLKQLAAIAFQYEDSRFRASIPESITIRLNGEPCALFVSLVPEDPSNDRYLRLGDTFLAHRPDYWTALVIEHPHHAYISRGAVDVGSQHGWPRAVDVGIPADGRPVREILRPLSERRNELWNGGVIYTPDVWREIEPIWRSIYTASLCDAVSDIITYVHEHLSAPGSLDPRMRIDVRSLEASTGAASGKPGRLVAVLTRLLRRSSRS